ncbi:MAG: ComEC/Rec2 family competence protein [Pseudobdellovibrionaceae bacterium]
MILIALLGGIYGLSHFLDLPTFLSKSSLTLHHLCLQSLPKEVENLSSLESLVCGKNMQDLELKHLLIQTSLIHIFIVSGSHFIFLRKILARLPLLRFCPIIPLSIYALVTLCQPPSLRSLLFIVLAEISVTKKLFITPVILVFLSCTLCLALFPQWITSRSLLMSLMAALVIAVMSDFWGKDRESLPALFLTQSVLYFIMGFCLWGFSNLHPLSILFNLIFGPLIGALLFPLSLIVVFLPSLAFLFDGTMNALTWALQKCSIVLGYPGEAFPLSLYVQWPLFLCLVGFSHLYLITKKRQQAKKIAENPESLIRCLNKFS